MPTKSGNDIPLEAINNAIQDGEKKSSPSTCDAQQFVPPDGGWGWVCVFASFMLSFICDGLSRSFGVLFVDLVPYFGASTSSTAWTASLFFSVPLLTGPIASYFTDRWGCRFVTMIGAVVSTLSIAIAFFATELHHLLIAFTICGIGMSICYVTAVVIVAHYFDKKLSLANGFATCGAGVGTIVLPPLTHYFVESYSWRGCLLIYAGVLLNNAVFGALMRDSYQPEPTRHEESTIKITRAVAERDTEESLSASVLHLPTYISSKGSDSNVAQEISKKEACHIVTLLEQYPDILNSYLENKEEVRMKNPKAPLQTVADETNSNLHNIASHSVTEKTQCPLMPNFPICQNNPSHFQHFRLHHVNMSFRGAMLNIPPYHLKASSCPDIYLNVLTEDSKKTKRHFCTGLKDVLLDMVDIRIFRNLTYCVYCVSNLLLYTSLDAPYLYIPDYALQLGISGEASSYLISILGILNTIGMVVFGYIADKPNIDAAMIYSVTMCVSGVAIGLLPFIRHYSLMAVAIAIYGFSVSTNYALTAGLLVEVISLDNFANAYGIILLMQGISSLVGPPFAGWLRDVNGSYDVPFAVVGICTLLSGVVVIPTSKRIRLRIISKK